MKGSTSAIQVWLGSQSDLRERLKAFARKPPKAVSKSYHIYSTARPDTFVWARRPIDLLRVDALGLKQIDTWVFRPDGRPHLTVV